MVTAGVAASLALALTGAATTAASAAPSADKDQRLDLAKVAALTGDQINQVSPIELPDPIVIELPAPKELETTTTKGTQTVVSLNSDILFDFDSATLNAAAAAKIGALVQPVPKGAKVEVYGFTDSVGDDAYNLELSTKRAQAVADAIRAVRPDLVLDVQGKGEADPVQPNQKGSDDNPEGRAANRRVELRYQS